jgi:hypothetical protein
MPCSSPSPTIFDPANIAYLLTRWSRLIISLSTTKPDPAQHVPKVPIPPLSLDFHYS